MDKVLIVIDMQNDFITGSLKNEAALSIVENVAEKIRIRKNEGWDAVFTLDTHTDGYLSTLEGKYLPVPHCIKGTFGHELVKGIAELASGCKKYEKPTFSSAELIADMAKRKPDEIEIVGICTDICVVSNALGLRAALPECEISADSLCCAATNAENQEAALRVMRSCHINVK